MPNTLRSLKNSDQASQRWLVETIADFHPATVRQQHVQRSYSVHIANRIYDFSDLYFNQRDPSNNIAVSTGLLLKLFPQMTAQRAQCQPMMAAELATPQSARPVRPRQPRNLSPTSTMNYHSSLSAHDNSPSQLRLG
jgi:predicted ATP-dependent Lon-type protease